MSTFTKPLLALLISIILFAGFTYLTDNELPEYVQTRFFNPSILNLYVKENAIDANIAENHIYNLQKRFAAALTDSSVRSSFLYNQSADEIFDRSRIFGILMETTSGLQSVQFVDSNGIRIHYSTSPRDIISRNNNSVSYRNYNEDPLALSYDIVSVTAGSEEKFTMDEQTERLIFSFPFFDSADVYRGTALFTISIRALADRLVEEGRLKFNEDVSVIKEPAGILLGSPVSSKTEIIEKVAAIWNKGLMDRVIIDTEESGVKFSLISLRTNKGLFFGRLINDYLFSIPESMKIIFKLSIFLTFFLSLYFIFNLKPNAIALVQNRIKRLRDDLFEHLYINKTAQERTKWILELEQRRDETRSELKRNLRLKPGLEKNIDTIINKSWDELLSVLKSGTIQYIPADAQTTEQIQILKTKKTKAFEDTDELEEIEALEDADELEEIETLEDADELEEIETLEDADELDESEDIQNINNSIEVQPIIAEWKDLGEFKDILKKATSDETNNKQEKQSSEQSSLASKNSLLKKAEKLAAKNNTKGLLARGTSLQETLSETIENKQKNKGLLARGTPLHETYVRSKGQELLAAESNFEREEIVISEEEQEKILEEINVVSPFSSMFASLKKD